MYKSFFLLSVPIVLSQGIQTILLLLDRYLLSAKDPLFAAVATTSGFVALSFNQLFSYALSFASAPIGNSFGKNDLQGCYRTLTQCFAISTLFVPIILLLIPLGQHCFSYLQHPTHYIELENSYFRIAMISYLPLLYKTSLESYLIGVKNSRPILLSNLIALLSNTLFCYLFVLGPFHPFFHGADGAAYALLFSNVISTIALMAISSWKLSQTSLGMGIKSLFMQGFYVGSEKFINNFCFVLFVNMLVVYGSELSVAVSIVFSWDRIAFLPLMGISGSLLSLYSHQLGEKNRFEANRSLHAGLQVTLLLMGTIALFFWTCSDFLIQLALRTKSDGLDIAKVQIITKSLLRTACFYIVLQAFIIVYKAALRSLGLASWCFRYSALIHLLLIGSSYIGIYHLHVDPFQAWGYFMAMLIASALMFTLKFYLYNRHLDWEAKKTGAF